MGSAQVGFDADLLRAVAVTESGWNQLWVGDSGYSYGLMQIKRPTGARARETKILWTTYGCPQAQLLQQPDSTKPGEVQTT
jgi:soluble lytic murein transglycosylase-like protein